MFAFSIFDLNKKTLYLARDRVGEKPLYYIKNSNGFFDANKIKSFWELFLAKRLSRKENLILAKFLMFHI